MYVPNLACLEVAEKFVVVVGGWWVSGGWSPQACLNLGKSGNLIIPTPSDLIWENFEFWESTSTKET